MIILSYFTKGFFQELIDEDLEEKVLKHFSEIIKNELFFFIGDKDSYKEIIKKNLVKIKNNQKKSYLIEKIFKRAGWLELKKKINDLNSLFNYLNSKNIKLDFIYSSNEERSKKIGQLKNLKKKTFDIVVSSKRILSEENLITKKYKKKETFKYKIYYEPREEFEKVRFKKDFLKWLKEITKIIFVCDKILIYDRYIASKLVLEDTNENIRKYGNPVLEKHFQSESYFKTLKYFSNIIENSFVGKENYKCEILSILEKAPKENDSKIKKSDNKKWSFFKKEVNNFLHCLENIECEINIKGWQLWNNIHERYLRFYLGGNTIKVLKFNPGFNFIMSMNTDRSRPKKYEFDSVDKEIVYRDQKEFLPLIENNEKTALFIKKAS